MNVKQRTGQIIRELANELERSRNGDPTNQGRAVGGWPLGTGDQHVERSALMGALKTFEQRGYIVERTASDGIDSYSVKEPVKSLGARL